MMTDTEMLDYLDSLSGKYTGKVILRESQTGRGWRLHETSFSLSFNSVRDAIEYYAKRRA